MKVRYFITSILIALFFTGCELYIADNQHRLDREDLRNVVSTVLRSQLIIEDASSDTPQNYATLEGYLKSTYDYDRYNDELHIISSASSIWLYQRGFNQIHLLDMYYEYHDDSYDYHYNYSGIINNTIIGAISFETVKEFYGEYSHNPDLGSLRITNENVTIYLDVVNEFSVDITLYDNYDNIDGIVYKMSWNELGF